MSGFASNVLEFNLDIRADAFNEKNINLKPSMVETNIRGKKIFFVTAFKYSKTLLKEAGLPNMLSTFTTLSTFKELFQYGTKDNEIFIANTKKKKLEKQLSSLQPGDSNTVPLQIRIKQIGDKIKSLHDKSKREKIVNSVENIKYMYNLIFKENNKLFINNVEYQISSSKPERFDESYRNKVKKYIQTKTFVLDVVVYITAKNAVKNMVSKARLECKYKKQDILNKLRESSETLGKYIPIQYIKKTAPKSPLSNYKKRYESYDYNEPYLYDKYPSYSNQYRSPPYRNIKYGPYLYNDEYDFYNQRRQGYDDPRRRNVYGPELPPGFRDRRFKQPIYGGHKKTRANIKFTKIKKNKTKKLRKYR